MSIVTVTAWALFIFAVVLVINIAESDGTDPTISGNIPATFLGAQP